MALYIPDLPAAYENVEEADHVEKSFTVSAVDFILEVPVLEPGLACREVLDLLKTEPSIPCAVLCDEGRVPAGLVMRDRFYRQLTGRFAPELFYSRPVQEFAHAEALTVDLDDPPETIIHLALDRPEAYFYDCVMVTENGKFRGVITVQHLMVMSGLLQLAAERKRKITVHENYGHVSAMERSMLQVTAATQTTFDHCLRMKDCAANGRVMLDKVDSSYAKVVVQMDSWQRQVSLLMEHVGRISALTSGITELADKSKLLAMNASIEAAHAGEHGRGFQIVAAEVRSLAGQTRQLAADISGLLEGIGMLAAETGKLTQAGAAEIEQSSAFVGEGSRMFGDLEQHVLEVERTSTTVHQLAENSAEQAAAVKSELSSGI